MKTKKKYIKPMSEIVALNTESPFCDASFTTSDTPIVDRPILGAPKPSVYDVWGTDEEYEE